VSALALRTDHAVRWVTAAPLWRSLAAGEIGKAELDRMQQPALLRLTTDEFMDELTALLDSDPAGMSELEAKPKSYRTPPPGEPEGYEPPLDHLKLYQPVQGHFNLVAATLVCQRVGLPDKAVDIGAKEQVGFVMRRLAGKEELAWNGNDWVELADAEMLADGEQIVSMFPVPYAAGERTRRLFAGLVPTSSLESFKSGGAVSLSPQAGDRVGEQPDRRLEELDLKVIGPLKTLKLSTIPPGLSSADQKLAENAEKELRHEASLFILLDLGDFLARNSPQLWKALEDEQRPSAGGLAAAYDLLRDRWADQDRGLSWQAALVAVRDERARIWGEVPEAATAKVNLTRGNMNPDELRAKLEGALPLLTAKEKQEEPHPPFEAPKLDGLPDTRYTVRCVYRRPACGALHPDLLSEASEPFAIASFFDFDAPARSVHISLPFDTSIAGLRKAPKNVKMLISKELRQQMSRATDMKKVLDGKLAAAEPVDLGVICSFSIPIITICALILLMIVVSLLDIIFHWTPFFRICFPTLKAKS
jgi:hypothetical protein